jgi:cysteine desulfurase
MKPIVYVDNNATTKISPEVLEAMMPFFKEQYGNPSSMHSFGGNIKKYIEEAREKVADFLGASESSEIIFTGCGTESDNMAVRGALAACNKPSVITTQVEHPAVLHTCRDLAKKGTPVTEIGVSAGGALNSEELKTALKTNPALVSIMWANNETGVIFPIEDFAPLVKESKAVFHVDAVQAAGKIPIDMKKAPVDLLSISGHKLHTPKGVGALYIRKGTRIRPILTGGNQEFGRRSGTENVPYIVGLGKACELAKINLQAEMTHLAKLRDRLEKELVEKCSDSHVNGLDQPRLPGTANISFQYIEGESILLLMDEEGICASSGSACSSGSLEPSHVLRAMGVPFTTIHGSVRFSLSRYNTDADIDFIIEKLPPIVKRLREISPFGK